MTPEQLLKLIMLLDQIEMLPIHVEIAPYAPERDGSQKYGVEVRDVSDPEVHPRVAPLILDEVI